MKLEANLEVLWTYAINRILFHLTDILFLRERIEVIFKFFLWPLSPFKSEIIYQK